MIKVHDSLLSYEAHSQEDPLLLRYRCRLVDGPNNGMDSEPLRYVLGTSLH